MLRRFLLGAAASLATAALLGTPGPGRAQTVQIQNGGAVNYYPGGVNYPVGYYFGVSNQTPNYFSTAPTYLTSINYPLVYGAYSTFPFTGAAVPTSAMISPYNTLAVNPTIVYAAVPQVPPPVTSTLTTTPLSGRSTQVTTLSSLLPASVHSSGSSAVIDIRVPDSAEVRIQGRRISQTGKERQFVSPPLDPGQTYSYDVTASWSENGRSVTQRHRLIVRAGDRSSVTFLSPRERSRESSLRATESLP